MIRITGNYDIIDAELDRLGKLPGPDGKLRLDAVLQAGYTKTQAQVHKDTTSLAQSGKTRSEIRNGVYGGELEYGGASTGVNNPVTYAIYEKARGGEHDFFAGIDVLDGLWVKTMMGILSK